MGELLEAVTLPGQRVHAFAPRVQAKAALAELLSQAAFDPDRKHATWARRRVAQMLSQCAALLIS